jgi:hypothetical protein
MEFSNLTNRQGLVQDTLFLCHTTTASYPLEDIVRNINREYHNISRMIWEVADGWQYDDSNATDSPISRTTLTHAQQSYSLPSTAQRIQRVEVLDSNGRWSKLTQIDMHDVDSALPEYMSADGMPVHYDLFGASLFLYPAPSSAYVTTSEGLNVYYDRNITEFTTASTTASPGFAEPFHRVLSLQGAIDFSQDQQDRNLYMNQKLNLIEGMKRFYGHRNVERRSSIRPAGKKHWQKYL